jgi:GGDEF domain-containing protein
VAHNGEADIKGGPTALVMLADNRLYAAKQAGRNRVNDSGHSAAATDVATRKSA